MVGDLRQTEQSSQLNNGTTLLWQVSWDVEPRGCWTAKVIPNIDDGLRGASGGSILHDNFFGTFTKWARWRVLTLCTAQVPLSYHRATS